MWQNTVNVLKRDTDTQVVSVGGNKSCKLSPVRKGYH